MKRTLLWGLLVLTSATGCSSMNNAEKGMLGGAAVGTGAGALLGRGNPAAMALGAVAGTVVGGVAGANQDYREDRRAAINHANAAAAAQASRQMQLDEIVQLSQRGTPDDIIMQQIASTGSIFPNLTTNDITYLQDQRVSSRVISYMQQRRYVVVQPRPYYPPPPPPPVSYGVGVVVR